MTEQELYKKLENYHTRPDSIRDIVGFANAYAAAQVAEKEREIEALKSEIKRMREGIEDVRHHIGMEPTNQTIARLEMLPWGFSPATEKPEEKPAQEVQEWNLCCPECHEDSLSFINEIANGIEYFCNSCGHTFMGPSKKESK